MEQYILQGSFNPCFDGFCSKTKKKQAIFIFIEVSILVLMDFALKQTNALSFLQAHAVSILVLMDFALKLEDYEGSLVKNNVSILVLMDFALKLCFFQSL